MTEVTDFDIASLDSLDEAEMNVKHPTTGADTGWVWTFYGPGHPVTVALSARLQKENLQEARAIQQAQVNNKKWKPDDKTADQILKTNVTNIVERLKSFTPVKLGGETFEFSKENAIKLLLDRRKGWLLLQVSEYLREDASFTPPSATS